MARRHLLGGTGNYIDFAGTYGKENGYESVYIIFPDGTKASPDADGKLYLDNTEYESLTLSSYFGAIDFTHSGLHLTSSGSPISLETSDATAQVDYINTTGLWSDAENIEGTFVWDGIDGTSYPMIFGGYWPNITTMENAFNNSNYDYVIFKENTMGTGINNFQKCTNFRYLFCDGNGLKSVDFSDLNSLSGNFSYAFMNCPELTTVKFPKNFAPTGFGYAFHNCQKINVQDIMNKLVEKDLTNLTNVAYMFSQVPVSGEITVPFQSIANINNMFEGCKNITKLSFPNMTNTTSVTIKMMNLCKKCTSLEECKLPPCNMLNNVSYGMYVGNTIFSGCTNLKKVDASNWNAFSRNCLKTSLASYPGGTWTDNNGILTKS